MTQSTQQEGKFKSDLQLYYNETEAGVNIVDEMCNGYSIRTAVQRWSMVDAAGDTQAMRYARSAAMQEQQKLADPLLMLVMPKYACVSKSHCKITARDLHFVPLIRQLVVK